VIRTDLFGTSPKDLFLYDLRKGSVNLKYKQYKESPISYVGGKSRAVGFIIEHIPGDIEYLVSPFTGGSHVEIAVAKEFYIPVQSYDIFELLVNYWEVQLTDPHALADYLSQWYPEKELFDTIKERLRKHWDNEELLEDPITRAAHYFYSHILSYGPFFLGWFCKGGDNQHRYKNRIQKIRNFQAPLFSVNLGCFQTTIPKHNHHFLYCDPPYFLEEGTVHKAMYPHPHFPIYHKDFPHDTLRDLLHEHGHGFVLSYNDCPTIREWYSDFSINEIRWPYHLGTGATGQVKYSTELLIVKKP